DVGAAPDPDDADRLAGRDRFAHRPVIDDARDEFFAAAVFGHHDLDRFGARQFHRPALAAKHPGIADRLIRRDQGTHFKIAESPFQHFLGFARAVVRVFQAVDDNDQPYAVLHGGA